MSAFLYMGSLTKVEKLSRKHVMHKNFVIGGKKVAAKCNFYNCVNDAPFVYILCVKRTPLNNSMDKLKSWFLKTGKGMKGFLKSLALRGESLPRIL
jgi:hypothetical protein